MDLVAGELDSVAREVTHGHVSGTADPLYRKAIRASMGAVFKLPYVHAPHWPAELDELASAGFELHALHLQGSVAHTEALRPGDGLRKPIAVMAGSEYGGLSEVAAARAHHRVRIPMSGAMDSTLDSLNVNVATAIVLQRVFELSGE